MILKTPLVLDTSYYEIIPDFASVEPRPVLVITKATEGIAITDSKFAAYYQDIKNDGILRGCYHFHRKAFSAITQAQYFCQVIRPYVVDSDLLILDVEEGGESAAQLQQWFLYVRSQYPNNRLMIYSRRIFLTQFP